MPTTPIGTRTWRTVSPLGSRSPRITSPTGSGRAASSRSASAIAWMRPASSRSRSTSAGDMPAALSRSQSLALARTISAWCATSASAMACSARSLVARVAVASGRAATFAARATACTAATTSASEAPCDASAPDTWDTSAAAMPRSCQDRYDRPPMLPPWPPLPRGRSDGSGDAVVGAAPGADRAGGARGRSRRGRGAAQAAGLELGHQLGDDREHVGGHRRRDDGEAVRRAGGDPLLPEVGEPLGGADEREQVGLLRDAVVLVVEQRDQLGAGAGALVVGADHGADVDEHLDVLRVAAPVAGGLVDGGAGGDGLLQGGDTDAGDVGAGGRQLEVEGAAHVDDDLRRTAVGVAAGAAADPRRGQRGDDVV